MAENTSQKKYHNMTLEEIHRRFFVRWDPSVQTLANYQTLNAIISNKWQEASYYYNDTAIMLAEAKDTLRRYRNAWEDKKIRRENELISLNQTLPKADRLSDSARECRAIAETMDANVRAAFATMETAVNDLQNELSIWEEVRNNLKMIAQRLDSASISLASELKIMRNEPTNIPTQAMSNTQSAGHHSDHKSARIIKDRRPINGELPQTVIPGDTDAALEPHKDELF